MAYQEDEFVRELAAGVQSGRLLPENLRATVRQAHTSLLAGRESPDLFVEFILPGGTSVLAVIECRTAVTEAKLELAASQLRRQIRILAARENSEIIPMFSVPYINDELRQACRNLNLGYIDLDGNFHFSFGQTYYDIVRPHVNDRTKRLPSERNVFLGKSRRVVRALLTDPFSPVRVADLAMATDSSVAQVSYVLQTLREQGFARKTESGTTLVRPGKLLRTFAQESKRDYEKRRKIFYGFAAAEPPVISERLKVFCQEHQLRFAFSLSSGLEVREVNVIDKLTAIYVDVDPEYVAKSLELPYATIGANIIIMRAPTSDNTDRGGVFYKLRPLSSGLPGVSLPQAYLDFMLYPGRGKEQAEFISDRLLGFTQ